MEKTQKIKLSFLFLISIFLSATPFVASAAKMSIAPQSGVISAGSSFTINIFVSSTDQAMNGVSGEITFPTDLLSVSSISKFGSIIDVWAQDPTFSNTKGTIDFEGVALSPGFTGSNGKVIAVTFHAKAVGTANIKFSSGSVLANDGMGTDILDSLGNSQFKITAAIPQTISSIPTTTVTTIPALNPPAINYNQNKVNPGDPIVITGTSQYPNSQVVVSLQYNDDQPSDYTVFTDKNGNYTFAETSGAKEGTYKIWVKALDTNGNTSAPSPVVVIHSGSLYSITVSQFRINIFVLIGIICILLYLIRTAFIRRHRTKREFSDIIMSGDKLANVKLHNFNMYINKQIETLESNEKFNRINEYETLIENFKKNIADYRHGLEKKPKE